MRYDTHDVMMIEVARVKPLEMSDHHPLVASRMSDGRKSYAFAMHAKDGLWYCGSGPTPEEARFLRKSSDGSHIFIRASPSDRTFVSVLRYDPDAYMHCEYYANKLRVQSIGTDSTGPFSWKWRRYLPAYYQPVTNTATEVS